MLTADLVSKNPGGPSGGNVKGHLTKGPANPLGSPPNPKIREAAWETTWTQSFLFSGIFPFLSCIAYLYSSGWSKTQKMHITRVHLLENDMIRVSSLEIDMIVSAVRLLSNWMLCFDFGSLVPMLDVPRHKFAALEKWNRSRVTVNRSHTLNFFCLFGCKSFLIPLSLIIHISFSSSISFSGAGEKEKTQAYIWKLFCLKNSPWWVMLS